MISRIKSRFLGFSAWGAVLLLAASFVLPITSQSEVSGVNIFEFQFNPYGLLSFVSAAILLILLVYVALRVRAKSDDSVWLTLLLVSVISFALLEGLQRLSVTAEAAIYWGALSGVGASMISMSILLFALSYTNPNSRHRAATVLMITGTALMTFFQGATDTVWINNVSGAHLYAWGWGIDPGPAVIMNTLWVIIPVSWACIRIFRFRHKTHDPVLRMQALLVGLGFLIPLVVGTIADLILPSILGKQIIPTLATTSFTITAIMLVLGTARYKMFRFSSSILANNILSTMHDMVVVTNPELRIQFMNAEAEKLFTLKKDYATIPLSAFFEQAKQGGAFSMNQVSGSTTATRISGLYTNLTGERQYFNAAVSRIMDDDTLEGYIWALSDVTALHVAHEELQREKENVEDKVRERTQELREAQAKLLETDKLKTEFVLLTSHNLRTPLTVIRGNLELLGAPTLKDDIKSQLLTDLSNASVKLGGLVEDLLTITTIEAGDRLIRETVQLQDVLHPLLDEAKMLEQKTKNSFVSHIDNKDAEIQVNGKQLQVALRNLLDNAFKFTKDGRVTLSAAIQQNQLTITVTDTGIGIQTDELPKLFTKFHRATDTMRYNYDGEGIGLYLTKLIVEDHGGKIEVSSIEGKGTSFTITIPLAGQADNT